MPFCSNCGNKLSAQTHFCGNCGEKQAQAQNLCVKCGKNLDGGEKFCSSCGTPVAGSVETKSNQNKGSEPEDVKEKLTKEGRKIITSGPKSEQNKQATNPPPIHQQAKKKKKGCRGCALISVLILAGLIVGTMLLYNTVSDWWQDLDIEQEAENLLDTEGVDGIVDIDKDEKIPVRKSKPTKTLMSKIVNTDSVTVEVKASEKLTVILPVALFDGDEELEVKELKELTLPGGKKSLGAYDITLGNLHQFDDFVELQFETPAGFNPKTDFPLCYSPKGNNWEQVLSFYDADIKKIRVFTDHFSMFAYTYKSFELVHDPMMKVAAETANLWGRLTSTAEVKLLEGYNPAKIMQQQDDDYLAACWNSSMELYGLESAGLSFAENVLSMGGLSELNNMVGNIGYGLALVNAAMDVQRGKTDKAILETFKNTYNFAASKIINTKSLNIAFIGVFAIDYALTSFANEAWDGRKQLYRSVFDNFNYYQRTKYKKNLRWWKKEIYWRMEDAKDPSKFESVVNSLIDEYIQDFWDDNVERAIIQAELQKHGWTYNGGYSDKTKKELNPEFRTYVLQYIQPLIERMYKNYLFKAKQLQQQQIQQFGQILNQEHQIRCMVELDDADEAEQYEGAKVVFKVAGTIKKMWQGFLNKEAIMDLYCTKAGFIHAGCPPSATLILDPADEKKSEKYSSKVDLKSAGDETQVVFSLEKRFTEYLWKLCDYKSQEKGPIKEFTAGSLKACEAFVASDVKKYADLVNSNSFTDPGKATTNFKDLDEFGSLELVSKELYRRTMLGSVISKDYNASADFNEQQGRASTRNLKNDVYYKLFGKDVLVVGNYEFLQTKDPKKATTEYTVYVYGYVKGIKVKE